MRGRGLEGRGRLRGRGSEGRGLLQGRGRMRGRGLGGRGRMRTDLSNRQPVLAGSRPQSHQSRANERARGAQFAPRVTSLGV